MIAVQLSNEGFVRKMNFIVRQAKRPRAIMAAAGRAGANRLKRHFIDKNLHEPNKLGGKRENFWRQIAQSVQSPIVENDRAVSVHITDPRFAQKLFGGTITAKRAGALTIPETPEAYGRAASTFERETGVKLFVLSVNAHAFLAGRFGDSVQIEYLLAKSVTQQPDKTALPPIAELETVAVDAAQAALDRQLKEGGVK